MMAVMFRCPHRPWRHSPAIERGHKAKRRSERYEAPADTVWEKVNHIYNPDKTVTRKVLGELVAVKPYAHELGHYWRALVVCPVCSDTIEITTDVDPTGGV